MYNMYNMLNLKVVTNATIHKLPKIDLIKYHFKSIPVSSRASLPGHRQCLHLCFSCREYAFCFVLFFLFCFSVLFISCILPHFVISAPAARSSWAAWLWLFMQANIKGVTLNSVWLQINKKSFFTHFRLPSLPWLRSAEARSAARDIQSWGEHWGPNFTSALGEKGKHRNQSLFREIASKFKIARSTPLVTHLAARCNGVSSSLPMQFTSAPRLNKSYKGNFGWIFGLNKSCKVRFWRLFDSTIDERIDGYMVILNLCRLLWRSSW